MKGLIKKMLTGKKEEKILTPKDLFPDMDEDFFPILEKCMPFTMTSVERMFALFKAIEYIIKNNIEGDFVECGVWKGGSAMMMAYSLAKYNITNRKIYLYDTFEGMTRPSSNDIGPNGLPAEIKFDQTKTSHDTSNWCYSPIQEVTQNIKSTGYPIENFVLIKGKVEETIPQTMPSQIAMLRLDTDWYDSTSHELNHMFPKLSRNGVLIIDDYGYWKGCRKAVDEYFIKMNLNFHLNRIDDTGRLIINHF